VKLCLEKLSSSLVNGIIFDFDYTLADSSRGVVECINFALDSLDLPTVSAEQACRTIGISLPNTFLELAGQEHSVQSDEFVRLFIKRADEVMADMTVLFEAVPQTVRLLKKRGHKLGIVSTKFRYRIETILNREGLSGSFDIIVGGEDVAKHKPDPAGLHIALDRLGCTPADALYVGDSLTDAKTAQRANVPFAAVLSGVTPRDAFNGYSVYRFLESVSELPYLLKLTDERTTDK
jgi:phosphoglycolate phosphatase